MDDGLGLAVLLKTFHIVVYEHFLKNEIKISIPIVKFAQANKIRPLY